MSVHTITIALMIYANTVTTLVLISMLVMKVRGR